MYVGVSRCLEPLKPRRSLEVASSGKLASLPILAAYVTDDDDAQVYIVYGSLIKPAVEKIVRTTVLGCYCT